MDGESSGNHSAQDPDPTQDAPGRAQDPDPTQNTEKGKKEKRSWGSLETWKDAATVMAAVVAIFALLVSALSFYFGAMSQAEQREIQADQTAHTAVQDHMKLRIEYAQPVDAVERQLEGGEPPEELPNVSEEDRSQYLKVAEHGIAMAEFVYSLRKEDPGWRDTVESWIKRYRAYLLDDGGGIDCGDYGPDFVQFTREILNVDDDEFCTYPRINW
jgi:hypothetical protein